MIPDAELLRRYAVESSEKAFAELVRRHVDFVYAAARRQTAGNADLARDATQLVFADLARKAGAVSRHPVLAGWLHTSARFAASRVLRTERRRHYREREAWSMNEINQEPQLPVNWLRLEPLLDEVIGQLKPRERDAVLLRFFAGQSLAEIGARLSLTETAARSCLHRALDRMGTLLSKRGITSTAVALAFALEHPAIAAAPTGLAASVTSSALVTAAGKAGAVGLFTFMTTTKVITGLAALATIAAVWTAVYQSRRVANLAATVSHYQLERDALRARVSTLTAQNDALQARARASASGTTSSVASASVARNSADQVLRSAAWDPMTPINFAIEHPEARETFVDREVMRAREHLARFFALAHLTPAEQSALEQELHRYAEAAFDYYAAVRAQGFGPMNPPRDPQTLAGLLRMDYDVTKSFNNAVRGVLGSDRAAMFDQYVRAAPAQNLTDQLAGRLYATANPLTASQAEQVQRILQQTSYRTSAPDGTNTIAGQPVSTYHIDAAVGVANLVNGVIIMPGKFVFAEPITDAAIARAANVLTPEQTAVLRELQAEQVATYRLTPATPPGATPEEAIAFARKSGKP